ncbi:MAG: trypsin-like peptidase domain-containing protein [Jiangellaceae bacterium]|nr:trypsin-like peptidase domain-containing protein [Jiangellaceae bacterium]
MPVGKADPFAVVQPALEAPAGRTHAAASAAIRPGVLVLTAALIAVVAGAAGAAVSGLLADRLAGSRPGTVTVLGADETAVADRPPESVAGIAADVLDSVVSVTVGDASGSGFIIAANGYVLTNSHVIAAATDGTGIELGFFDGSRTPAEVVGRSPSYDLAVLRVDRDGLRPVRLGTSADVAVGDPVLAIGSPLGLDSTVTSGIISAVDRAVTAGGRGETAFINALQTDAAINPGNSGGPLVNAAGRVIGVNSAIASVRTGPVPGNIGLGFAIPIDQAARTAGQIIETGRAVYPVMGVRLDSTFTGRGARIAAGDGRAAGVEPDGPAAGAGIEPGDVITRIGDRDVNSAEELIVALRAREPGERVTLRVERGGSVDDVTLVLGSAVD